MAKFQPWRLLTRVAPMVALVAAGSLLLVRPVRSADPPAGASIAIANMDKIITSIKENADLKAQFEVDKKVVDGSLADRKAELQKMQQELSYLKSDSPQYADKQDQLLKKSIEADAWVKETQLSYDRKYKQKTLALFAEIQDAIAAVAQKDGISLVITDQRPKLPDANNLDGVDANQLGQLIAARTIQYADPSRDISGEVITLLDKNYSAKASAPAPK